MTDPDYSRDFFKHFWRNRKTYLPLLNVCEQLRSGVVVTDAAGLTKWVNHGFEKMTGYTKSDMLGKKPGDVLQGAETNPATRAYMGHAIRNGQAFATEVLNYKKNGDEFWMEINCQPIRDQQGPLIGFIAILPEVSQRKSQEIHQMFASQTVFRAIFDKSLVAMLIANNQQRYTDANEAACQMLGYSHEELIGMSIEQLVAKDANPKQLWGHFLENGTQVGQIVLEHQSGRKLTVEYQAIANFVQGLHLSILHDVTDRLEQEKRIAAQNKRLRKIDQEKNKLFSLIAHDLRSPLQNLLQLLNLLQSGSIPADDFKLLAQQLSKNVHHTANLLDNLLVWSKSQLNGIVPEITVCQVAPIIEDKKIFFHKQLSEKQISIVNHCHTGLQVWADANMLDVVFRNLLGNAIKFSQVGSEIHVGCTPDAKQALLYVQDFGVGVPAKMRRKIFSYHYTTPGTKSEKGTGLGLNICKDFVEAMNGKIWVESKPNKGSKFCFSLPLSEH